MPRVLPTLLAILVSTTSSAVILAAGGAADEGDPPAAGPRAGWIGDRTPEPGVSGQGQGPSKVLNVTNEDGTVWRITYFPNDYHNESEADQYAADYGAAARHTYTVQTLQWAFESIDPDQVFDITVDGCTCIEAGADVQIHLDPKLEDLAAGAGADYPDRQALYRSIIGHEWHHHLQYSIQGWALEDALIEGGARFIETILEPAASHQPRSIQFIPEAGSFNIFVGSPSRALQDRSYDFGLFWGYLYANDGGLELLRQVYVDSETADSIPAAVTSALTSQNSPHGSFEAAYADFAFDLLARTNFVWEDRDWTLYLDPLHREGPIPLGGLHQGTIGGFGLQYVSLPQSGNFTTTLNPNDAGGRFEAQFAVQDAAGWSRRFFDRTHYLGTGEYRDVAAIVFLKAATPAGFELQATAGYAVPPVASVRINEGAEFTNSRAVTLQLSCIDPDAGVGDARYSNDAAEWTAWESVVEERAWTLDAGDGSKTVYFECRNLRLISDRARDAIVLDTTPPSVAIDRPAEHHVYVDDMDVALPAAPGALGDLASAPIVVGTVTVQASAADAISGVDRVEFFVDGVRREVDVEAPYEWIWPAGIETLGDHTLGVRAFDRAGNHNETSRGVTVVSTVSPLPPVGSIAVPLNLGLGDAPRRSSL